MEFKPEYLNLNFKYNNKDLNGIYYKINHIGLLTFLWGKMEHNINCHNAVPLHPDRHGKRSFQDQLNLTDNLELKENIDVLSFTEKQALIIDKLYCYWYYRWLGNNQDEYRISAGQNIKLFTYQDNFFVVDYKEKKRQKDAKKKLYQIFQNQLPLNQNDNIKLTRQLFALMIIANRIRNNIFHGAKAPRHFKLHQTIINISSLSLHLFTNLIQGNDVDNQLSFVLETSFDNNFNEQTEKVLTKLEFPNGNEKSYQSLMIFTTLYGFMEDIYLRKVIESPDKSLTQLILNDVHSVDDIVDFELESDCKISFQDIFIKYKSWSLRWTDKQKNVLIFDIDSQKLELHDCPKAEAIAKVFNAKQTPKDFKHIKNNAKVLSRLHLSIEMIKSLRDTLFHGGNDFNKWILQSEFIDTSSFLLAIIIKSYITKN